MAKCGLCEVAKKENEFVCSDCYIDDNTEILQELNALKVKEAADRAEIKELKIKLNVMESLLKRYSNVVEATMK